MGLLFPDLFKFCIEYGFFFFLIEKANVPTDHNIRDKQLLKNQRPISLLRNCSKIFERLVYDKIFQFS